MLSIANLEKFTRQTQTSVENVVREYCQHLFLSYLYKQSGSEKLLFKGGTALRVILGSPRFSEDIDFTGITISQKTVEDLFTDTLAAIENVGVEVDVREGKSTTGGYLGIAKYHVFNITTSVKIEVSFRRTARINGTRALIVNDYIPSYTLVHLPLEKIIQGKLDALFGRAKPRDFYDYFFLLSGNYPLVKEKETLIKVSEILKKTRIDFRSELKKFLPASHAMHLRDFKAVLQQHIERYL